MNGCGDAGAGKIILSHVKIYRFIFYVGSWGNKLGIFVCGTIIINGAYKMKFLITDPLPSTSRLEAFGFSMCDMYMWCDIFVCGDMRIVKWRIKKVGE